MNLEDTINSCDAQCPTDLMIEKDAYSRLLLYSRALGTDETLMCYVPSGERGQADYSNWKESRKVTLWSTSSN